MNLLKELVQIKKIIAIALTAVFCALSLSGQIESKDFLTVFMMVISFYYGQSTARQAIAEKQADKQKNGKLPEPPVSEQSGNDQTQTE